MKTTLIRRLRRPTLRNPVLIEGLPGMGYVGKLAAEHLVTELDGKKFAEIYSSHFPHHVSIEPRGILRPLRTELYHVHADSRDLILWVGDVQPTTPSGHYEVVERLLDLAWGMKVRDVFTLGGFATGQYREETPRVIVFGDKELAKTAESCGAVREAGGGPIIGAAGLLVGLGKLRGMRGLCMLGETPGMVADHRAAKAVLEVLTRMLGIEVGMRDLERRAEATKRVIDRLRREMERRIRQLEREEEETTYIG